MRLLGANPHSQVRGLDELAGRSNYFLGNDPEKWRTNVPNYARVRLEEVYPGIDLLFYGHQGELEYDWIVKPGADPQVIRLEFKGIRKVSLNDPGDLVLDTPAGEIVHRKLLVYQELDVGARTVTGSYELKGGVTVGFRVGQYDRSKTLVIDPVLSYSALFGGSGRPASGPGPQVSHFDQGLSIAVDNSGNSYVAGVTYSTDFPTLNPLQSTNRGSPDIFIAKINSLGSAFIYSTYLGGSGFDEGRAIAVDAQGNAYVTGVAGPEFPTVNAIQSSFGGGSGLLGDAFVAKLNPTGSALLYSTYLGGTGREEANGIAVDPAGNAYVTGFTGSANFPITAQAFQTRLGPGPCPGFDFCGDAFVSKVTSDGRLLFSTYLGGSHFDSSQAIAVDGGGNAYVTGFTHSVSDYPTTEGSFQRTSPGGQQAFVTKIDQSGSRLVYSTYLGGTLRDQGNDIAIDSEGNAYVTGWADSDDFPVTAGAFQARKAAVVQSVFVTKLNRTGSSLLYSTYLGGSSETIAHGIAVDSQGNAYVTGMTSSIDFPTVNPIQAANGRCIQPRICSRDAFVAKLNSTGSGLIYSTYLGGTEIPPIGSSNLGEPPGDKGLAIAADSAGNAYVTGDWRSFAGEFPSAGPLRMVKRDSSVFVVKISETGNPVKPNAVTNAASFVRGAVHGGIVSIFGTGLTRVTGIVPASSLPLPTELEGTSVTVNGIAAPLFAVANVGGQEQINLQIPFEVGFRATFVVNNNGVRSDPFYLFLTGLQPGIFTIDGTTAAVQHGADFALVTADNPATKGEVIVIYATGLGPVQPPVETGKPAPFSPLSRTSFTPVVTVGGVRAEVLFSGLAPGFVGLYQVNIRVPEGIPSGNLDLVIFPVDAGQPSNAVKLPVR